MSFQAYLDTIKEKTGKGPGDFVKLAGQRGLLRSDVRASEIVSWLKTDFGLGHGHAMAMYSVIRSGVEAPATQRQRLGEHFKGGRAKWADTYAKLFAETDAFAKDKASSKAGDSYISLLRNGKKFAIVKVGVEFLDIGIKLEKNPRPNERLEEAGSWNSMVSHRVRLTSPYDLDAEVIGWLRDAYDGAQDRAAGRPVL
jgi:hypothetical protein